MLTPIATARSFSRTRTFRCSSRLTYCHPSRAMGFVQDKRTIGIVLAAAFILLLPLLAMQITDEVVWDLADFAVAGALLVGTGLTYELAARMTGNTAYRAAVGLALAAALIPVYYILVPRLDFNLTELEVLG